jgi:transcriptional regulator with XRE-family HTH domain
LTAYTAERARILSVFGGQLRGLREQRSLAQERLAAVANVHRKEIGVLERGQCEPGVLTLLIVANALEVPPHILLDGLPVPRERRPRRC